MCEINLPWLIGVLLAAAMPAAAAPAAKRVLVVHSFVNAAPPFTTHSTAFETTLTAEMGERVDLDEVSLDVARYATLDMEEALVEFLRKRREKWQPDLVVPVGSPAGVFVAQNRERLFPDTPVIYTGMDQRRLPPAALLKDATFVGESFNFSEMVEDILRLAPATTNIAVVIGASPLERFWAAAIQREWAAFTNRVSFTWLDDLPYERMLARVAALPPRSFIFLVLLMRDASGVTHNADEALKQIHAVANAPVNSIFQHQLGLGIVGGRLYQAELEGAESARRAIRILRGESASIFPPLVIGPLPPRYDWRELRRWNISEASLPPGSTVLFQEPTSWERYRWRIIAIGSVGVGQAVLILLLLASIIKHRRAERSLAETEARFRTAADAAPLMIWMSDQDKRCTFFNRMWIEFTGRTLEQERGEGWTDGVHPDDLAGYLKAFGDAFEARQPFVMEYRLRRHDGVYRWVSDSGRARYDAQRNFVGYVGSCVDVTEARLKTEALGESESRLRAILDTAVECIITFDPDGIIESVNKSAEQMFGYTACEMIGRNVNLLIDVPPGEEPVPYLLANDHRARQPHNPASGHGVSGRRKDGSEFPLDLSMSEIVLSERRVFTGFVRDVTERKHAERMARELSGRLIYAQEAERARLARELHDDITQRLARLAIDAGRAESQADGPGRSEMLREMRDGLVRLSEDVHSLSYRLHPSLLQDLGLSDALKAECERFSRQQSIPVEVKLGQIPENLPMGIGLCLFRVTQEALRNVARHSHATAAGVMLRQLDGGLQLAVSDCGCGFDPNDQCRRPSLGLASMHERVRLLEGELEIDSTPDRGTTVVAWVPLNGTTS